MRKSFLIALIIFLFLTNSKSFAEDLMASSSAKVVYQLPYPGVLPDNPLYRLKALRDRIIEILVADPLKKGELNLLQADKRLAAGIALLAGGKEELALSTISKGENYFEKAITDASTAKSKGQETGTMVRKLGLAAEKHEEELIAIKAKIREDMQGRVQKELDRIERFKKQISSF